MKKTIIAIAGAALLLGATSCSTSVSKPVAPASLDDSLACSYGTLYGKQLYKNVEMANAQGQAIDSAAFIKGLLAGLADSTKMSYYSGALTGNQMLKDLMADSVDVAKFRSYFIAAFSNDTASIMMSDEDAQELLTKRANMKHEAKMLEQYGENKKAGEAFIADFKKEADVQTTESGIAYKRINTGAGISPNIGDEVEVRYVGKLINGEEFDASKEGETTKFKVESGMYGGVIQGWVDMLTAMKQGDKVSCVIPYELAYGSAYRGGAIEPFSALIFEIELVKVIPAAKPAEETPAVVAAN